MKNKLLKLQKKMVKKVIRHIRFKNHFTNIRYWSFIFKLYEFKNENLNIWSHLIKTKVFYILDKKYDLIDSIENIHLF